MIDQFGSILLTYGLAGAKLSRLVAADVSRVAPKLDQHAAHELNRYDRRICERGGAAADFQVSEVSSLEVAKWIVSNARFDRLYYYGPERPLHASAASDPLGQIVVLNAGPGGRRVPLVVDAKSFLEKSEPLAPLSIEDPLHPLPGERGWSAPPQHVGVGAGFTPRRPGATQRRLTTPKATSGAHSGRFRRPDCAIEPVRIVPSNPSSQRCSCPGTSSPGTADSGRQFPTRRRGSPSTDPGGKGTGRLGVAGRGRESGRARERAAQARGEAGSSR